MLTQDRTVKIGIETAANALRKFLNSGDSPADCTAILSTINSELQSMPLSETVQNIVQNFLESDLLSSASEAWNHEKISEDLETEILSLFHLVTLTIFEGQGDLSLGLQYRESHTNKLVCLFYHKLYKAALESPSPKLTGYTNIPISEKLICGLSANPSFVMSFFDHHGEFLPYAFLVQHIPVFFEQVSFCLTACKEDRYLLSYMTDNLSILVKKVTWGEISSLWDLENAWKLLFFCDVLQGRVVCDQVLLLFELFLHSIDSWKVLFEVSLYFLNMVSHNPQLDAIIAESTDTRMVLVMRNATKEPLTEQEELVVWDFICKVLESNSVDLILGLFYDTSAHQNKDNLAHILKVYRRNTYRLMASDVWFVETFTKCFPDFCKMAMSTLRCNVEFSLKKSLACFFNAGINNFLSNSLITNRFIYSVTIHLLTFDCSEIAQFPCRIIDRIADLLQSIDASKFKEAKQSVSEPDGSSRSLKENLQMPSADEISETERPRSGIERLNFKSEGMRQNFFLLEAIVATLYAAIKAKSIALSRSTDIANRKRDGSRECLDCQLSLNEARPTLSRGSGGDAAL
ncbi:hypothetical protein METBIDRAFT_32333 [Metschnikowia bicuspidata var. bicuspidata NRRL YB-4993]|uniref:Uncharacterized protein n=1 Tax=Metschnikowia bicuspidata var. bicuspidata NRRL YB-4993 TaxID=869754 RepID=A0A1A0H8J7_9ASCO|nr:hypothetical protein METBIDRAFT_32333 [Metschnikowia bicuspidata var. bicuspidata NRRL YB-4993]OBA20315.1 hypothetical protein METBIDRAFT_32333 [Metschnikowia bicuspidata var. bicuspidata NRRL YB-4993]